MRNTILITLIFTMSIIISSASGQGSYTLKNKKGSIIDKVMIYNFEKEYHFDMIMKEIVKTRLHNNRVTLSLVSGSNNEKWNRERKSVALYRASSGDKYPKLLHTGISIKSVSFDVVSGTYYLRVHSSLGFDTFRLDVTDDLSTVVIKKNI